MHRAWPAVVIAVAIATSAATAYADCRAHSAARTTALIELYTSEGLSLIHI